MRSIYAKILLWSLGTFVLSLAVFGVFTFSNARRGIGPIDFFHRTLVLIEEEVCRSYEQGGRARLAEFLDRLNTYYGVEHFLTDAHGRDLVNGADRSSLLADLASFDGPPRPSGDRLIVARSLRDGRYRLLIILDPRNSPAAILAYFGAIVMVIAILGYLQEVRLDDLLKDLDEDCEPSAEAKGCRLALRVGGPASLIGDRELLRRAVENVMRNAIRHASEGTAVEIDLRLRSGVATISVSDYGTGVSEESLEAIFRRFFRIGDDRSRSSGGAGLGLSIARRSIELHQGHVSASHAQPGLRVTIGLPASLNGEDSTST